jgi:hypothetical protein
MRLDLEDKRKENRKGRCGKKKVIKGRIAAVALQIKKNKKVLALVFHI